MSILSPLARAGARVLSWFGALLALVFGRWQWQAPGYLRWLGHRGAAFWRAVAARPARAAAALAVVAGLSAGGWFGWQWWQAQPKPVEVKFEVLDPQRTEIENGFDPNPLVVKFSQGVAPIALVGRDVTQGIEISPPLAGTWHWESDRELRFLPKEDWPVGEEYQVGLARDAVAPQIRLAARDFVFHAPAFVAKINGAAFHVDPVNPAQKEVLVELEFTHPVDPAALEARVSMQMAGASKGVLGLGAEKTKFTVSYDKYKLRAYLHSQNLPIPAEDTALHVEIDKGVAAARGGKPFKEALAQDVAIPGLYSLKIGNVEPAVVANDQNDPEQVLAIETTTEVAEKDIGAAVSVWELPVYHPATKPEDRKRPYAWNDPAEVTDAALKAARKLELTAVPTELEYEAVHSFKYRADVGRHLFVRIEKGLKAYGGYLLGARDQRIVKVPPFPSELRILSQGALLSMSGDKKVAVLVRDLPGVRVELARVLPGQLQHLVSQASGTFDNPAFYSGIGPDNLTERYERKVPLPNLQRGRAHYEAVDVGEYLKKDGEDKRGIFLLTVQGYTPDGAQARTGDTGAEEEGGEGEADQDEGDGETPRTVDPTNRVDHRLILVTDLGLIAKRELDGTQVVYVQSIHTGAPVAGANVDVIARNGSTLYTQTTDAQGMVRFPKLDNLSRERSALMYLVRKAGDTSFLPLNRYDRQLDTSRFDVGGEANARAPDQLNAYLFSDRGIYRPGDTFHIGMIIKSADWTKPGAKPLAGLPLEAEVLDARGLSVKRERIKVAPGGFNELVHTTLATSPTGSYAVNLYTVKDGRANQQIGSTQINVQEFEPDRMKVSAHLSSEAAEGWVHPDGLKARVNALNLFGTPAENRRVEATLSLTPAFPSFRSHPGYVFYDAQRAKEGYSEKLADGKTDAKGEAEFDLGLEKYARATYRLHFIARAYEPEGGRSVAAEAATLVSELPYMVGMKADGPLDFVARGAKRGVSVIAIDPQARKTAADKLTLVLLERKFVSVLTKQDSGVYKYESRRKEVALKETPLSIAAGGYALSLATDAPGNFAYSIRNADGLELNRIDYSVAGQGNVTRSLERNAELELTLDRKDYAPGDEIQISVRAPYTGAGLITIERDKVYAQAWFKADKLASVQKIRLPKDFEGNGYVSVQFVRDPGSDEIFMSPLSWGVVPFATNLGQRTNTLKLEATELVKPGQKLAMKLSADKPTHAVVFAVDEGILQVARYQNADPLGHFFQKRALEVRTSQILDLILPEFKKLMAAAAPGGDAEGALGRHLNPFKRKHDQPAVWWSGIVEVNGTRNFEWTVPETFNGTLRVMAVAVNDTTLGTAQTKATVRGDFVLSPNAPLAVTPGDEFEVSVGVANNVAGSGKEPAVAVALQAGPAFEVIGNASQSLKIGEMREGVALFRVKVKDGAAAQLGSAPLTFSASLGNKGAKLTTEVSVRPATPYYTQVTLGSFKGSAEVPVTRDLFAEYRQVEAAVSPLPLVAASGLSAYLANFEHSCTEQLVSQAVPALVLAKRGEFAPLAGAKPGGKSIVEAVRVLRTRQNAEGGFGLWDASVAPDEFASVYAAHWMLEARERGEAVPQDMLQNALAYLEQLASTPAESLYAARTRAYAAYLLTRQGVVTTAALTRLRETLDAKYAKVWHDDLVAVWLAASYQQLKETSVADSLIARPAELLVKRGQPFGYADYYDPLVRDAGTLYVLARHFPARVKALPPEAMIAMMKPVADNRFNTLSAAWTILALDAYANAVGNQALGKLSITAYDAAGKAQALALPQNLVPRVRVAPGTRKLGVGIDAALTGYYALSEAGFDKTPPAGEVRHGIELIREYLDAKGKPVTSIKIGDEITVRLRVRTTERDYIGNLALVDLLPGGFEPVLQSRALGSEGGEPSDAPQTWNNPLGRNGNWNAEYADIREDRVVLYGSANKNMAEFSYRIKATNAGRFVVPPAYGESLYERDVRARTPAGSIVVEKPAQ